MDPEVLVCLGATAAKAVFGAAFKVTEQRGTALPRPALEEGGERHPDDDGRPAPVVVATIHPSAVLRAKDGDRDEMYAGLVADLRVAAKAVRS